MDIIRIIGNTAAGRKGFYETKRGEKSQEEDKTCYGEHSWLCGSNVLIKTKLQEAEQSIK